MSDNLPRELTGNAAKEFAESALEKIRTNATDWTIEYRDPRDGSLWVMDYPHSDLHGGGPPRLRRVADETPGGSE